MKNSESSVFSLRLKPDQKQKFEALSEGQNKSEIFTDMLETYESKQREKQIEKLKSAIPGESSNPTTQQPEPETESEPLFIEETNDQQQEIVVKLDPVHVMALRETILRAGFVEETNEEIYRIDTGKDESFFGNIFGNDFYSGAYAGVFRRLKDDISPEVMSENMANSLLNLFMGNILTNSEVLSSPVTREYVKQYLKDNQAG
ncbi:MAG: hypothetical protein PHG67_13730 [Bacteroidales bacterium]|nr:hypothetical protein [Bacteroidales bacterium]